MIIAEIGANFVGDVKLAQELIKLAKENNADLVKLQLYNVGQLKRTPETLKILKEGEHSFDQAKVLFDYGEEIGIEVFFSVFDVEKVEWCERIGVKRYKIAARIDDIGILAAIAETKKPIIASVSPHYPRNKNWAQAFYNFDLLYCSSKYPSPLSSLGFEHIDFDFTYQGFSDHTIGLDAAKIALARGASIIEKHFAIDHHTGIDAEWSMTPDELKELKRWELVCRDVL